MVAIPVVRGELHYLRALASLAVAARGGARAIALRVLALADARALVASADAWMDARGVRRPARFAATLTAFTPQPAAVASLLR
ncbi:hypothetical protein [Sorangium sp. So ce590]|uniref:hypothetical protein n=1 Tax=unclassified Sorangium TaxID=2621164 RepID=UPI003F60319A